MRRRRTRSTPRSRATRSRRAHSSGGAFFGKIKFLNDAASYVNTSTSNAAANARNALVNTFNVSNYAEKRFNVIFNESPALFDRIGMGSAMMLYLVFMGVFKAAWISTWSDDNNKNSEHEVETRATNIQSIFKSENGLRYATNFQRGVLVYIPESKMAKDYTQSDVDTKLNSIMEIPGVENVDTKNQFYVSNSFVVRRRGDGKTSQGAELRLLTIPTVGTTQTMKDNFEKMRNVIQNLLKRISIFKVDAIRLEVVSKITVEKLIDRLVKPSRLEKNRIGGVGELSVRNHLTKFFTGKDTNWVKPSESVSRQLTNHFFRAGKEQDIRERTLVPQTVVINYKYDLDKNDLQRGIVAGILLNMTVPGFNSTEKYAEAVLLMLDKTLANDA